MDTGIYKVRNLKYTNKIYIGRCQTTFRERWSKHIRELNKSEHENKELQLDWNLYGQDNFKFEVFKECDPIEAKYWELVYIDLFRQEGYTLYNVPSVRDDIVLYVCNKLKESNISFEIDKLDDRCIGKRDPLHWQIYAKSEEVETYVHLYNLKIYEKYKDLDKLQELINKRHEFVNSCGYHTIDKDISMATTEDYTALAEQLFNEIMLFFYVFS